MNRGRPLPRSRLCVCRISVVNPLSGASGPRRRHLRPSSLSPFVLIYHCRKSTTAESTGLRGQGAGTRGRWGGGAEVLGPLAERAQWFLFTSHRVAGPSGRVGHRDAGVVDVEPPDRRRPDGESTTTSAPTATTPSDQADLASRSRPPTRPRQASSPRPSRPRSARPGACLRGRACPAGPAARRSRSRRQRTTGSETDREHCHIVQDLGQDPARRPPGDRSPVTTSDDPKTR